jgi:hypothetical protein
MFSVGCVVLSFLTVEISFHVYQFFFGYLSTIEVFFFESQNLRYYVNLQ